MDRIYCNNWNSSFSSCASFEGRNPESIIASLAIFAAVHRDFASVNGFVWGTIYKIFCSVN